MTAPIILTMPAGAKADPEALRREFGMQGVSYNWHPSQDVLPGVLHLTCMHPEDLRAAGCGSFIERGWSAQPVAMPYRPGNPSLGGQRGHIRVGLALDFLFACLLVGLYFGIVQHLDGPSDHQAALDTAAAAAEAPISAAEQLRRDRVLERMALRMQYGGENAVPDMRADGSIQWRTKRGHKTGTTPAAVASNSQWSTP